MAYTLKYYLNWVDNRSGLPVVTNIYQDGWDGDSKELINADSPCIVSENNGSEDIFIPVRSKEYRIRFITDDVDYPGIEDFTTNSDNEFKVELNVNGVVWLTGFLLTDQMSELWFTDATKHVIELTATDNLGTLKKLPLKNIDGDDFIPSEKQTFETIVKAALNQAIPGLAINIFDNLFETSFDNRSDELVSNYTTSLTAISASNLFIYLINGRLINPGDTIVISNSASNDGSYTVLSMDRSEFFAHITVAGPIVDETTSSVVEMEVTGPGLTNDAYQQTMLDMRTFTTNYEVFDDAFTVLEKILISRNSCLFQHVGEWYIVRIPELFGSDVINGTKYYPDGIKVPVTDASWTADLSQTGDIVPVENFMIKSYLNPVLWNLVQYNYTPFEEVVCNQLFHRGAITVDTDSLQEYEIDCWQHFKGGVNTPTTPTVNAGRRVTIDAPTGSTIEDYVFLEQESGSTSFIMSEPFQISSNDKIRFSVQRRSKIPFSGGGTGSEGVAVLVLNADDSTQYTLDDDGTWYPSVSHALALNFTGGDDRSGWHEKVALSDYLPKSGTLTVYLMEASDANTGQETHFKDLRIDLISYIEGRRFVSVVGDYHKLTLPDNLKDTASYEVFISDSPKHLFKGAMYEADGVTLTTLWYESRFPDLLYPAKRFNAIAHYNMSFRNMMKVEGSFLQWIKSSEPIIPLQKITITNGNGNKRFVPVSIRDINTSISRFGANLTEVYDSYFDLALTTPPIEHHEITTNSFTIAASEIFVPNRLVYTPDSVPDNRFVVGDTCEISGTASNDGTYLIVGVTLVISDYHIIFGATLTAEVLTDTDFTVTHDEVTFTPGWDGTIPANVAHEFKYVYKNN